MVARNLALPKKLKQDAIVEAVLEIRFSQKGVPEIFFGRFVDHPHWKAYKPRKLPTPALPPQLLAMEPNLRLMPVLEAVAPDGKSKITVGNHAVAIFRGAPYPGWDTFGAEVRNFVDALFDTAQEPVVGRVGLKYSNALTSVAHGIRSVADLDLRATIAADHALDEFNLNFFSSQNERLRALVRIATKGFLQGAVPTNTSLFVEVDVHTPNGYSESDKEALKVWIEAAHEEEKREFFHLFHQSTIDSWTAE